MPKEGASSGQLLGGEGNTLRQNQGWVPQTWAQGLGSSVLSAPGGGGGLANASFLHQDMQGPSELAGIPTRAASPACSLPHPPHPRPPKNLPLSGPASPWTPLALTSFCSSLKRSCRGSTWEDPPGKGTSREETCSTCSEEKHRREHPQKAAG